MDLGEAIEKAEGKEGKLVLNVIRESKNIEVAIPLEAIGAFSATFPFNCKKSELVRAKALKYFVDHPDVLKVWQAHDAITQSLAFFGLKIVHKLLHGIRIYVSDY